MTYTVTILRRAMKAMAALQRQDYDRVRAAIGALAENPRPVGCKKLKGRDGWRIRAGDFRVVYEINDGTRVVTVLDVGNRRDVYG